MKVLVARTDRLGDVVLSLPVFAYVKERQPDWEIHALVAPPARNWNSGSQMRSLL